jgi:pimeloyl-ACP methyl ester carboxylesterase
VAEFVDSAAALDPIPVAVIAETPVSVAGRRFQTRCVGTGDPAVLLVSGADMPQATWHKVHAKLAAKTRVCTYDRLGVGESGPRPARQTVDQLATDLDGVMAALRLSRPLVVVGHSLGGAITMVWAASHPNATAGVVLVDAVSATAVRELEKQVEEHYPDDVELFADLEHVALSDVPSRLETLPRLGAVPLVVLARTLSRPDPHYPEFDVDALERAWAQGQRHWATYSRVSELVNVENAGHYIHLDQLNTAVAAVLRML